MIPVDLIVPDAGPLISLAHAGRLDLLDVFERPVAILDIVRFECLKKLDSPDHAVLKAWFAAGANRLRIVATPLSDIYERAIRDEISGHDPRATRGLGDAAFAWLLPNIEVVAAPGTTPLVLTEDRNLGITLADHRVAHILSTRAWLTGLENAGLIASATDIISQIGRHGRRLSTLNVDRPVENGGSQSDWLPTEAARPTEG